VGCREKTGSTISPARRIAWRTVSSQQVKPEKYREGRNKLMGEMHQLEENLSAIEKDCTSTFEPFIGVE
jgi:hypothetical protein